MCRDKKGVRALSVCVCVSQVCVWGGGSASKQLQNGGDCQECGAEKQQKNIHAVLA